MKPRYTPVGATYTCPMHPDVRQTAPGRCPKCGMELVPRNRTRADHEELPSRGQAPQQDQEDENSFGHGHIDESDGPAMPEMTHEMRGPWLWTNSAVIMLGVWLMVSPFTFGYTAPKMVWNDFSSGLLLVALAGIAFSPRFDFIGRWGVALVGTWLQFAPLVFWAPTSVAFATDTFIGAFAIIFSVLVPMMPGMAHHMEMKKTGPEIPPGWTYNPSSWPQRAPMIVAAFLGWMISRYLAAYQLGYISHVWEPFFGKSTELVLTSKVSRMWPVSDAGLGAFAYTFEMLMAWMGGKTRWRSMPWMVTFFFILVVPLGTISILLVILQPVAVGHWCTLCLATALIMLVMIPFTIDEVVAMGQFLKRSVHEGKSFWRTFWIGGTLDSENRDRRTPRYGAPMKKALAASAWGVSVPWNLLISATLGIWLMFAPSAFGSMGKLADSDHLVGALIVTTAVISMAEAVRSGRLLNLLFAAWVIASPWVLPGAPVSARWNDLLVGIALIVFTVRRGPVREHYAGWDRLII